MNRLILFVEKKIVAQCDNRMVKTNKFRGQNAEISHVKADGTNNNQPNV
jgi:hypothetical protein